MREILFNPGGNYVAAALLGGAPVLLLLLLALLRRADGGAGVRGLPLLASLLIYYGILYWWLFYDQFYRLEPRPDGLWRLEYRLPTHSRLLAADDIADIALESGDLRTYRMTRLVIIATDGQRYPSAQISARRAQEYLDMLAQFRQAQRERL